MDPRLTGLDLKTSLSAIADLVLPRVCTVCGRPLLLQEKHICVSCLADLPETHFFALSHNPMADKFNAVIAEDDYEPYAYAAALYYYSTDNNYCHISQALKYRRDFAAGRFFARMLGRRLARSPLFADVDLVVPVPLHWTRRWKRGYNQAEIIAREVATLLGAECRPELLRRARRTSTQTRLSGEEKRSNVSGAFKIGHTEPGQGSATVPEPVEGRSASTRGPHHILLIDDVFTSGSTLAACQKALRTEFSPGETRISVATLAYVGEQ